ncbi:hypothetical protein GCM10010294_28000 [Streptomyces griseoloalbus]|uniref:FHA domain-containing protein n=1 Tax=Streptomyces griseoloalbus TaxID=67303 RepID=UPI00198EA106|nr:hypothetical protein GCM10010294_28000 [Streptomyces griseoloalbus]
MTANDRNQDEAKPESASESDHDDFEDDGWVSLSERPLTPRRPEAEARDQGVGGSPVPPPPLPDASPPGGEPDGEPAGEPHGESAGESHGESAGEPQGESDGWVSVGPGTLSPPPPAPERTPARPARTQGLHIALHFPTLGGRLLLNRGQTVRLGRSRSWATPEAAEILADESTVSGQHASVEYAEDGTVWLTEVAEGSTNGIRVNHHQVLTPGRGLRIRTGDTVWLGPHVNFLVRGGTLPGTDTVADDTGQGPGA